jgi:hypothetical protein
MRHFKKKNPLKITEMISVTLATGGTGFQHVSSITLGFAIFLPSLYFRKPLFFL